MQGSKLNHVRKIDPRMSDTHDVLLWGRCQWFLGAQDSCGFLQQEIISAIVGDARDHVANLVLKNKQILIYNLRHKI